MAGSRQLILILDTTATMRPAIKMLREAYIDPLIRTVVDQSTQKKEKVELAMVLFRNDRRYASYLVHPSSFTRDKQVFLSWLDQVEYSEGGLSHNAIGEALAAALQLSNERSVKEKHFVLVTNSAPLTIPNQVYGVGVGNVYDQAALIGRSGFLSVISPHQIKELEEIFAKAKPPQWNEASSLADKRAPTHLILLRGLKIAAPAPPPPTPAPTTTISQPVPTAGPTTGMVSTMPTQTPSTMPLAPRPVPGNVQDARKANVLKPLMPTTTTPKVEQPTVGGPAVMAPMAIPPSVVPSPAPTTTPIQPTAHMTNLRPQATGFKPGTNIMPRAPMNATGTPKNTTVINLTNSGAPIQPNAAIAKPVMPPGGTMISPPKDNIQPMWEGTLAWHPHAPAQLGTSVATLCALAAYPHRSRMTDVSVYGAAEWPAQLVVTGVTPSKEAIQSHHKSALIVNFEPRLRQTNSVNNQQTYQAFINQLVNSSWAAVINIGQKKTLLIIPHKQKLLGLLLPKLTLNPRNAASSVMPRQPTGVATSGIPMTATAVPQNTPTGMPLGGVQLPLSMSQPMFSTNPTPTTATGGATNMPTSTPMAIPNFVPSGGTPSGVGMTNPFRGQQFMTGMPMTATAPPTNALPFDNLNALSSNQTPMNTNAFINLGGMPMHHRKS